MESAFGSGGYYLLSFLQFLYPFLGKIFIVEPNLAVSPCNKSEMARSRPRL